MISWLKWLLPHKQKDDASVAKMVQAVRQERNELDNATVALDAEIRKVKRDRDKLAAVFDEALDVVKRSRK